MMYKICDYDIISFYYAQLFHYDFLNDSTFPQSIKTAIL